LGTIGEQEQSVSVRLASSAVVSENEDETAANERALALQVM